MKNKLFTIIVLALLCMIALYAPISRTLEDKGIISGIAVGNQPSPAETHTGFGSGLLNSVENIRFELDMTYLNYMPLGMQTIEKYNKLKVDMNAPFFKIYDKLKQEHSAPTTTQAPDTVNTTTAISSPVSTEMPVIVPVTSVDTLYSGYTDLPVPEGVTVTDTKIEFVYDNKVNERSYIVTLDLSNGKQVQFIEKAYYADEDSIQKTVEKQVSEINRIATSDTSVNFVVYIPQSLQYTALFENHFTDEVSLKKYLDYYLDNLDGSINSGCLEISSLADRANIDYLTDHHWSQEGVLRGYRDIIALLRKESTDILPATQTPKEYVTLSPCKFYGSYSRGLSGYDIWEKFPVYIYDLPRHTAYYEEDGKETEYVLNNRIDLINSKNLITKNSNVYGEMFLEINRVTYPDNHTGRNLLLLCDSYSRALTELLASSFDNTYAFYYTNYKYGLDYNTFIEENNITDVVYVQFTSRSLINQTNDAFLDRIYTAPAKKDTED